MPKTTKPVEAAPVEEVKAETAPAAKAPAKRKTAAKSAAVQEEIVVQFAGSEWSFADLKEKVLGAYAADGHKGRVSKLALYVKPEERKVYYVINDKVMSHIDM